MKLIRYTQIGDVFSGSIDIEYYILLVLVRKSTVSVLNC